jgi:phosphoribosylanthranilate isomerase
MMVKICGITNRDDAMAAAEAGASALGFNFWRESPRYISPTGASIIAERLPHNVLKVGIFVDETAEEITRIALQAGLDVAQLHGSSVCPSLRTWRACEVAQAVEVAWFPDKAAEAYLLDTAVAGFRGGTGTPFQWSLARAAAGLTDKRIIVAGGLDETNVQEAMEEARPWGVDACSRLETIPGRKDHERMRKFIQAAVDTES